MAIKVIQPFVVNKKYTANCITYIPEKYEDIDKCDSILFLHGVGENGPLLEKLEKSSNHSKLIELVDKYNVVLYVPQFVQEYNDWTPDWGGNKYVPAVIEMIKNAPHYTDGSIILTGISAGGGGVWNYLAKNFEYKYSDDMTFTQIFQKPSELKCAIPICGVVANVDLSMYKGINFPIWAFHAKDDDRVTVNATIGQADKAGALKTIYESGGHSIWNKVYSDNNLIVWMILNSKFKTIKEAPIEVKKTIKKVITENMGESIKVTHVYSDGTTQEYE